MRFWKLHTYHPGTKYIEVFAIGRLQLNFDITSDPFTKFYMVPSKKMQVLKRREIHLHFWRVTIMFSKRVSIIRKMPIPDPLIKGE